MSKKRQVAGGLGSTKGVGRSVARWDRRNFYRNRINGAWRCDRACYSAVTGCRPRGVGVAIVAGKESEDVFSARSAAEQNRELGLESPNGRNGHWTPLAPSLYNTTTTSITFTTLSNPTVPIDLFISFFFSISYLKINSTCASLRTSACSRSSLPLFTRPLGVSLMPPCQ